MNGAKRLIIDVQNFSDVQKTTATDGLKKIESVIC